MSAKNPLLRLLSWLWTGVDTIRKILHLFLLLFIFALFFGFSADVPSVIPSGSALHVQPYGALVEQFEGDPYDRAIAELLGDGLPQTRVSDIVDALAYGYLANSSIALLMMRSRFSSSMFFRISSNTFTSRKSKLTIVVSNTRLS